MTDDAISVLAISLFLITFFTRLLPSLSVFPSYDVYGHNLYARRLKQSKGGLFDTITLPTVCPKPFAHPFTWHWLVGLFDLAFVLKYQKYINPALDAFFISSFCWLLSFVIPQISTLWLIGILYAVSPLLFTGLSIGPRSNQFTPRLSSELIVCCYFLTLTFAETFETSTLVILLTGFGVLGLMWSKFSVQAILFISLLYAVLSYGVNDQIWVIILLCHLVALFILGLLSQGHFFSQLKEQLSHLTYYAKSNFRGQTIISNRNNFQFLRKQKDQNYGRYFKTVLEGCLVQNSYILLVIKFPLLIFVLVEMAQMNISQILDSTFLRLCLCSFVIYLFVNLKWFLFLGEAERYITNTSLVWIIAFFQLDYGSENYVIYLILIHGALYLLCETIYNFSKTKRALSLENKTQTFLSYLKGFDSKQVILMLPNYLLGGIFRVGISTNHVCLDAIYSEAAVRDDMPIFLNTQAATEEKVAMLDCLLVKYNVTLIVVDNADYPGFDKTVAHLSADWKREDIDLPNVSIFKR